MKKSERGVGKLTLLVFSVVIGAIIFIAYRVLPFYYCYFELENQMQALIGVSAIDTDLDLRRKLKAYMRRLDIPAHIDEVEMTRNNNFLSISLEYQEEFYIEFRGEEHHIHTFEFHAYADGEVERE